MGHLPAQVKKCCSDRGPGCLSRHSARRWLLTGSLLSWCLRKAVHQGVDDPCAFRHLYISSHSFCMQWAGLRKKYKWQLEVPLLQSIFLFSTLLFNSIPCFLHVPRGINEDITLLDHTEIENCKGHPPYRKPQERTLTSTDCGIGVNRGFFALKEWWGKLHYACLFLASILNNISP